MGVENRHHAEIGHLEPGHALRDGVLETDRGVVFVHQRPLAEDRGNAQSGRDGELGIAGHGGARRVEGKGAEVTAHGGHRIAQAYGTGRSQVVDIGIIEGVRPPLCAGTGGQGKQESR